MTTLDGYVAFTAAKAQKAQAAGRLVPREFGAPHKWVPFADTPEGAVDKAMHSIDSNPEAATCPTQWYVS